MVMWWRSLYWSSSSAAIWYPAFMRGGGFVCLRSPAPKPIFGAVVMPPCGTLKR
jgi:hypothetical protein